MIIHKNYLKNDEIIHDYKHKEKKTGPLNDIALVRFTLNNNKHLIPPICLPSPPPPQQLKTNYFDQFTNCKILGQGFKNDVDEENFEMSKELRLANVNLSSNDICRSKFEFDSVREKINNDTICITGSKHPCLGDSGFLII